MTLFASMFSHDLCQTALFLNFCRSIIIDLNNEKHTILHKQAVTYISEGLIMEHSFREEKLLNIGGQAGLKTESGNQNVDFSQIIKTSRKSFIFPVLLSVLVSAICSHTEATSLDHFSWNPIESPQVAGAPIKATITARDSAEQVVADFNGSVSVSAQILSIPPLVISEVDNGNYSRVEFTNPSTNPVDISGWKAVYYDLEHWPQPVRTFIFPAGTICAPQSVFTIIPGGVPPGVYPNFSSDGPIMENPNNLSPIAMSLLNHTNGLIDFFCASTGYPFFITNPVPIRSSDWIGMPTSARIAYKSYQRQGNFNHRQAMDWIQAFPSFGVLNSQLSLPFAANYTPVQIYPAAVNLTNGVWSGFLAVNASASNVFLHVDDENGHPGNSNPFETLNTSVMLTLPPTTLSTVSEIHPATIAISRAIDFDLVFNLNSDNPSKIGGPSTVTIPAGNVSARFNLTNFNDSVIDGIQFVTITASNSLSLMTQGLITNLSAPMLPQLTLPSEIIPQGGTITNQAQLSIGVPAGSNFQAELRSSDPSLLDVPLYVRIPAGQTNVRFSLNAPNAPVILGSRKLTVTASAGSEGTASGSITISGAKANDLVLQVPDRLFEGSGDATNATIMIAGSLETNLVINLAGSDSSFLQVPVTVVLPAGQTSVVIQLTVPPGSSPRQNQLVTVSASASGFVNASGTILIHDTHLDHFAFARIPLNQTANQPFAATILAQNKSGDTLDGFSGIASLSPIGLPLDSLVPTQTDHFTNGRWSGTIMINTAATNVAVRAQSGQTLGQSNPFNVGFVSIVSLNATVSNLVYDPGTDRIYATVPATAAVESNTVMRLNPYSATVEAFIPVDTAPGLMALSASNQFIYIAVKNGYSVQRLNLASQMPDLEFSLPQNPYNFYAISLIGLPNSPASLAIAGQCQFGPLDFIYDGEVARTNLADLALVPGFETGGILSGGSMYVSNGTAFNPAKQKPIGQYPVPGKLASGAPAPDPDAGIIYFLTQQGNQTAIYACDIETFTLQGSQTIPGIVGSAKNLVRWGTNGLAFATTGGQIFLIRSPFAADSTSAQLAVTQSGPALATPGSDISYSILVTNSGSMSAQDVILTDLLPAGAALVNATPSQGTAQNNNGILVALFGAIPPHGETSLKVTVRTKDLGVLTNVVSIASTSDSSNLAHKESGWLTTVLDSTASNSVAHLLLKANDLIYNPVDRMLYASVSGSDTTYGNCIVKIDPESLHPGNPIAVGSEPGALAISPDGRYLYAYLQSTATIVQVDLKTSAVTFQDSIYSYDLSEMIVLQDQAQSVLLSQHYNYGTPSGRGVKIISNGIATALNISPEISLIQPSLSPNVFYGYNGGITRVQLDGTNAVSSTANVLTYDGGPEMRSGGGLLFFAWGEVVDPESMIHVATFPGLARNANHLCPDMASGRVFYMKVIPNDSMTTITAYSLNNYELMGSMLVTGIIGAPEQLVRWGDRGLAFATTGGQLFSIQTPLVPTNQPADLMVTQSAPTLTTLMTNYTITLTISNKGPGVATGIVARDILPAGARFVSTSSTQGSISNNNGTVMAQLGTLAPGASAQISILLRPDVVGSFSNYVRVAANEPDLDMADNSAAQSSLVQFYQKIDLSIGDMVYDPIRDKLFATVLNTGAYSNSIVQIDPQTGTVEKSLPTGFEPGKIAITSDSQFLYVGTTQLRFVARINIQTWTNDFQFDIGMDVNYIVADFAPLPDRPRSITVSMAPWYGSYSQQVAIFDDGIKRPQVIGPVLGSPFQIQASPDGSTLYAVNGTFTAYGIDASGIGGVLTNLAGFAGDFQTEDNLLIAANGHALDLLNNTNLGVYPASGLVASDVENGRAYFLGQGGYAPYPNYTLAACSTNMSNVLWQITIPGASGIAHSLTRCGAGTLAFATSENPYNIPFPSLRCQFFLLRTSKIPAVGDLILETTNNWAIAGGTLTNTFKISNDGPLTATGVTFSNILANGSTLVTNRSTQGSFTQTNGVVICNVGTMASGSSVGITVVSTVPTAGTIPFMASISQNEPDIDPSNNQIVSTETIYPMPSVSVSNLIVPRQNGIKANFNVMLDVPGTKPITLYCRTINGTALSSQDYMSPLIGMLTFEPGATGKTYSVVIIDKGLIRSNLEFYLNVSLGSPTSTPIASATCTLLECNLRGITVTNVSLAMASDSITNALFNIQMSGTNAAQTSVDYFTQNGNAAAGRDYLGKSGTLVLPPGVTNACVSIPIYGIPDSAAVKNFYLNLANPVNAVLNTTKASASILNMSPRPQLLISGMEVKDRNVVLQFPGAAGAFYRLEMSTNLPAQDWVPVSDKIPGTGGPTFITDTNGLSDISKFYRLFEIP